MKAFRDQNFYELLELPTDATREQVESAYAQAAERYSPDSVVVYTLADPSQLDELRTRLKEALRVLCEPGQRAEYDRSLGIAPPEVATVAAGVEVASAIEGVTPETVVEAPGSTFGKVRVNQPGGGSRPKLPDIGPDTECNGELLREIREARGFTLQALADRTRISRSHLENVEADRYPQLPPTVYLRGILTNLARELKVDPAWVCRSYLGLLSRVASKKPK